MSKDAILQQMGSQGLNISGFTDQYTERCALCSYQFNYNTNVILTNCGHIACQDCSSEKKCHCGSNLSVKIYNFKLFNKYFNAVNNSSEYDCYDFTIKFMAGIHLTHVPDVQRTQNLEFVLCQSRQFLNFLQANKQKTAIIINNKRLLYNNVKLTKIYMLYKQGVTLKAKNIKKKEANSNLIIFFDRYLGGK